MNAALQLRAPRSEDYEFSAEFSVREKVRARMKALKPMFTKEQLEAASKHPLPSHLFQGEDVEKPTLD